MTFTNRIIIITFIIFSSGCVSVKPLTELEKSNLDNPPQKIVAEVDAVIDAAVKFIDRSESKAVLGGRTLNPTETQYALELGIKSPEKVHIKVQKEFPVPEDSALLNEFEKLGFGSRFEGGRTNGYGIFLKPKYSENQSIIEHELVHVLQMERMGKRAFLRKYLLEAKTVNYFNMPLEVEAFEKTEHDQF